MYLQIDSSCFGSSSVYNDYRMNIFNYEVVKTRLCNKMEDEFLTNNLISCLYWKKIKKIENFNLDSIYTWWF